MDWIILVIAGLLETAWATALSQLDGVRRIAPLVVFLVAMTLSMAGLAYALRTIPVGTGYAVWTGIGATGTAVYGMVALGEPTTIARICCLGLIVAGIVGLKLVH